MFLIMICLFRTEVPTAVPKPGSPTVTQGNLTLQNFAALRSLGLPQVTLGCEIYSLKIRVSRTSLRRANRLPQRYSMHGSIPPLATILFRSKPVTWFTHLEFPRPDRHFSG